LKAIRTLLLEPLGPDGDGRYVTQIFDLELDKPLELEFQQAGENAVLIVDGTFLQRPELRSAWDFVIFLDVPEDEARRRGLNRDRIAMDGQANALELYFKRYGPAFSRYEWECKPADHADVRIDNSAALQQLS
jgi:uridine kinase